VRWWCCSYFSHCNRLLILLLQLPFVFSVACGIAVTEVLGINMQILILLLQLPFVFSVACSIAVTEVLGINMQILIHGMFLGEVLMVRLLLCMHF
jgi:hypothetical protein